MALSTRKTTSRSTIRTKSSIQNRQTFVLAVTPRRHTASRFRKRYLWKCTWLLLLTIGSLIVLAISVDTLLEKFFYKNPWYNLARIEVDGAKILTQEEILALTKLELGVNLFTVDIAAAEQELKRISEISHVRLIRELPDTIRVEIEEREPVAWIVNANGDALSTPTLLLDAAGIIYLPHRILPEQFSLPVISGVRIEDIEKNDILHTQDLREALALLQTVRFTPECSLNIRAMDISKGYSIEVYNDKNARFLFDIGSYPEQLSRLQKLLDHCSETGRELEMVNLIPKRNTPVRFVMVSPPPRTASAKTKR